MILDDVLGCLRAEVARLEQAIAALEMIARSAGSNQVPKKRRGRKSMSEIERQQMSDRMKEYWATRRDLAESNAALEVAEALASNNSRASLEHKGALDTNG
jgi:hypothetical protein